MPSKFLRNKNPVNSGISVIISMAPEYYQRKGHPALLNNWMYNIMKDLFLSGKFVLMIWLQGIFNLQGDAFKNLAVQCRGICYNNLKTKSRQKVTRIIVYFNIISHAAFSTKLWFNSAYELLLDTVSLICNLTDGNKRKG